MVENSGAKNEMGKLFVDIGIGGLGKALKSLNSVSASFLLGKNAAMQFAQTISQPFKEAGNAATDIGKMSNALATTSTEFQKLALYLKNFNLSDAMLGDVSKLEQTFYDLSQGFTNLEGSMAVGLAQAGLNAKNYKGTFQDTMRMLDDLQKATANMSLEKRNQILRQIGISSDWGYLWDKGGRAGDYLTISDEQIQKLQSMQEAMNEAKNTLQVLAQKFLAETAPSIKNISDKITEWAKNFDRNGGVKTTIGTVKGISEGLKTNNPLEQYATIVNPGLGTIKAVSGAVKGYQNAKNSASGGAAPFVPIDEDIAGSAALPPNLSNMTQSITNNITHEITINGDNANQIANKIAGLSAQDIQYSQYQANNMPGI